MKDCDRQPVIKKFLEELGEEKIASFHFPDDLLGCFPVELQFHLDVCLDCRMGVLIVGMLIVSTGGKVIWLSAPPHYD